MIGQTISNCRVVEKLALWIRATLRNVWNRAGLILALSFVLVASAQNLRSPLPRGPVPPNSTQDPLPVAASPQLPHVFPPHSQSFLAGEYGPTQRKSTAGISTQSQLFLDTSAPQYETDLTLRQWRLATLTAMEGQTWLLRPKIS